MTYDMRGKTALVTGAASGIGAECVRALAKAGAARLVLVDLNGDALDAMAVDCDTTIHAGSVADESLWDAVEASCEHIDAAVLNAGIAGDAAPVIHTSLENWRKVMTVNLDGAFLSLRSAMRLSGKGSAIVLTASVTGMKAEKGVAAYASSKAAMMQLAQVAAKESAEYGVRVNAIAPGGVDTALWDSAPFFQDLVAQHQGDRAGAIAAMAQQATPLGRFATAAEIAGQILFLLSDHAAGITGTTLVSDGGYRL